VFFHFNYAYKEIFVMKWFTKTSEFTKDIFDLYMCFSFDKS